MAATGASRDVELMQRALVLAQRAAECGEVPVGAVVVMAGEVIAALRAAGAARANYRLESATLYVTLEPCAMCIGAAVNARVARVVFGAWDPKAGACGSLFDLTRAPRATHRVDAFGGVCAEESRALLRRFFEARR
jgi:tRNA(adenine34) deaminase